MPGQTTAPVITHTRWYRPFPKIIGLRPVRRSKGFSFGVGSVVLGFGFLIALGTVLLSLPQARQPGQSWEPMVSLFTAVSAACVTGLTLVDTGAYWSTFGQVVILGLVQAGGLGIMMAGMFILVIFGRSVSLKDRFGIQETAGLPRIQSVTVLVISTVLLALAFEAAGSAVLFYRLQGISDTPHRLWEAVFHATSAFNNAGFNIVGSTSLTPYAQDPIFLLTIASLIIAGGLGALVFLDMAGSWLRRPLSLQTKIVLGATGGVLLFGFLGTILPEYGNPGTLGSLPVPDRFLNALFHSVNTRAGFNTVLVGSMHDETLLITQLLMVIGGATGSTAGGIKVSTFAVLALAAWTAARGGSTVRLAGRELDHPLVYRALGVAASYMLVLFLGMAALTVTEEQPFRSVVFEATSAIGTVGLSTGITAELSTGGKVLLLGLMFAGRIGPLVLVYALARAHREPIYRLPNARVAVG